MNFDVIKKIEWLLKSSLEKICDFCEIVNSRNIFIKNLIEKFNLYTITHILDDLNASLQKFDLNDNDDDNNDDNVNNNDIHNDYIQVDNRGLLCFKNRVIATDLSHYNNSDMLREDFILKIICINDIPSEDDIVNAFHYSIEKNLNFL